jgi:hypothetical protein
MINLLEIITVTMVILRIYKSPKEENTTLLITYFLTNNYFLDNNFYIC